MADLGPVPNFRYPQNVGQPGTPFDKWIHFAAMSGRHVIRGFTVAEGGEKDETLGTVSLYLAESALKSTQKIVYDNNQLGPFVGAAIELFAQTSDQLFGAKPATYTGFFSKLFEGLKSEASDIKNSDVSATMLEALKTTTFQGLEHELGTKGALGAATGKIPNPRTDVLFNTVEFREHNFEFLLVPRNLKEAQSIDNIIHFFQFYSLPSYEVEKTVGNRKTGAFMMGFPYEFLINFWTIGSLLGIGPVKPTELEHVNKIGRSVLRNIEIDHAAGGKTAFVKNNGEFYPVATKLSLAFQEVRLLARDSDEIKRDASDLRDPREGGK